MKTHKISTHKTARYYTYGEATPAIETFWIVCHGYGQLARKFIRHFKILDDGRNFILAPEGLSRFYWEGFKGPVVASWMTSDDRLDEIVDYSNYLQQLYDTYKAQLKKDVRIILLGFSQGVATQCRWMMNKFPHFDHLILWAGLLPEDIDYSADQRYLSNKQFHFVYGKQDQFLNEERLNWHQQFASENLPSFHTYTFEGRHVMDQAMLKKLSQVW